MVNACPLQQKHKPCFEVPEDSVPRLHKVQYKKPTVSTMAMRGCKTYTCATENPELGMFWIGKEMNCKTCLEIGDSIYFCIFVC